MTFYALTLYMCAMAPQGPFCVASEPAGPYAFGECGQEGAERALVLEYDFRMSTGYAGEMVISYGCQEVSPQVAG